MPVSRRKPEVPGEWRWHTIHSAGRFPVQCSPCGLSHQQTCICRESLYQIFDIVSHIFRLWYHELDFLCALLHLPSPSDSCFYHFSDYIIRCLFFTNQFVPSFCKAHCAYQKSPFWQKIGKKYRVQYNITNVITVLARYTNRLFLGRNQ